MMSQGPLLHIDFIHEVFYPSGKYIKWRASLVTKSAFPIDRCILTPSCVFQGSLGRRGIEPCYCPGK